MRISGSTPKHHYENGALWEVAATTVTVGCPCWKHGIMSTAAKFLTVLFFSVDRLPWLFRVIHLWLLSNLCTTVSQSMHAAHGSWPFSSLLRHYGMTVPAFPQSILLKTTGQHASHEKHCRKFPWRISSKIFLLCLLDNYRDNCQHRANFRVLFCGFSCLFVFETTWAMWLSTCPCCFL